MTNNHWLAAVHRVNKKSNNKRISLAFFSGANVDTIIEPLKGCKICHEKEFEYKHLKDVTIGEYLEEFMQNSAQQNSGYNKHFQT